jgi:hypothetical protein
MEMLFICSVDRGSRSSFGSEFGHSRMNVLYPEGDADSTANPSVDLLVVVDSNANVEHANGKGN